MEPIFLGIAAALYSASALVAAVMFARAKGEPRRVQALFGAALIPHALAIVARAVELSSFPIASIHDGLSAFSLIAGSIAFFVAVRAKVPQVTPLAAPLLAALTLVATMVDPSHSVAQGMRSAWLGVHIGLALLGDAALAMAGVVALLYLAQERRLKQKKLPSRGTRDKPATGLHVLPPLERLDGLSVRLIQIGFPLMTLGLISGALYGKQVWGSYWTWDPRNTVSLMVWVLYALMIQARYMIGWRGRKAAILTVVGVVAILLAFVGLGLLGVGTHGKDYVS